MKILFIAGWVNLGEDNYINIDYIRDDITYFMYTRTEKMASIESRLLKEFNEDTYDWIIANSMGAFFASRLLTKCQQKQNVLFICPYIEPSMSTRIMSAIPFRYIPNWNIISNIKFTYRIDYIDIFRFGLMTTQLLKSVNKNMNINTFLKTYKNHNVSVIYGTEDTVAKMSPMTIANLMTTCKVYPIFSKHSPFLDDDMIQQNLKRLILTILTNCAQK